MIVTIFRSYRRPEASRDYDHTAARMDELARTMPGYISHKGYTADDGEHVTIVEFENEEAMQAWHAHAEHRDAQRRGRDDYYEAFRLQTCTVTRDIGFRRTPTP